MFSILFRFIPFRYSLFIKNVYHRLLRIYMKFYYIVRYGNTDMFNSIDIETTTLCNRRCKYCPNSIYPRSLEQNEKLMSEHTFKKIIDDLKTMGFTGRISPHFFGEPLLDKRLVQLMKYASDTLPRVKLKIYTNGDMLDESMLDRLYDAGVKDYVVSFHGNDEEKENNKRRILDLKEYIKLNKKRIKIKILELNGNFSFSNRGGLVKVKKRANTITCQRARNPLVVAYNGDVLLCCNDYLGQVTFGNVENNSIIDIWNKRGFKIIRRDIRNNIFKLEICKKCIAC